TVELLPILLVVIIFAIHRLHATVTTMLLILFWTIIIGPQTSSRYDDYESFEYALDIGTFAIMFLPVILLSVAPAKAISRRLILLALGLLLLIALNELSKLGIE